MSVHIHDTISLSQEHTRNNILAQFFKFVCIFFPNMFIVHKNVKQHNKFTNPKSKYLSKIPYIWIVLEIFKHRNELEHVLKFQVDPPFTYSDSVNDITLQESEISPGTSVVVTGWGYTGVSQYIKYSVEQQLTFCQNFSYWPPHIIFLPLCKMTHLEPD